jgi:hypothetical protein
MAAIVELASRKDKADPPRRLAPAVKEKLDFAEARLASLEAQIADLALDEAIGAPGAAERVAKIDKELVALRNNVARLQVALSAAEERDAAADAAERREIQLRQFGEFERFVSLRAEAMAELAGALERAAKAHGKFLAATDAMVAGVPVGCQLPAGITGAGEIGRAMTAALVAGEMFRLSAPLGAIPGSRPPSEYYRLQPEAIEPALDSVKLTNGHLLEYVRRQLG